MGGARATKGFLVRTRFRGHAGRQKTVIRYSSGMSQDPNPTPNEAPSSRSRRAGIPFWVTILRAILATLLGLALIIQPDKARPMLVNFMGMFWLASGFMSLRWGASGRRANGIWPIVAGVAGIIAGILALTRHLTMGYLDELIALNILGAVMILTGLIHISGGFRTGRQERHRTWAAALLGVFELLLGLLAILAQSLEFSRIFYWSLTIWALVGGFMLFTDALALRRRARQPNVTTQTPPDQKTYA
jgi:uncharacterized membrane protein HdeD (DUF308 family)